MVQCKLKEKEEDSMKLKGSPTAPALAAALLVGLTGLSGAAHAQSSASLTANAAVVSDYRFRGISQNFRKPALQAGADYVHNDGWYVGTWGSMIEKTQYPDGAGIEWDVYGGYKMALGNGWTLDAGLLQYMYPGAGSYNTLEAYIGASWDWFLVKYSHGLRSKYFGVEDAGGSGYLDVTGTYPLSPGFNVIAHVGYQYIAKNSGDYTDYKLGVTYDWQGFTWGAVVAGTNEDFSHTKGGRTKEIGKAGLVLSISKTF